MRAELRPELGMSIYTRLRYYNTRKSNAELQALTALPAAPPALDLDFTTGTLDPRITFTRAGSATYYNSAGVLSTAATNVARFDHDPVTLSSARAAAGGAADEPV